MGLLPLFLAPDGPALVDRLRGASQGERAGGNVPGNSRARSGPGPVADRYGRDELAAAADESVAADSRPVLPRPVVVARDHACPDVRPLSDLGVAQVRQMRGLDPALQEDRLR